MSTPNPFTTQNLGSLLSGNQSVSPISMTDTSNGAANLQNSGFQQSPEYQMLYGPQAVQNFQQSPGYQFSINEGFKQLMNNFASRGLGQSGALQQALQQYAQGTANNNFQQWQQNVGGLFNTYEGQVQNLANTGAASATALGQQSANSGNNLAGLLSGAYLGTGQGIGSANLSTGSNISSLYGNQGVLGANAYLNTGAAQANNLFNGMSLLAQINAQQQAQSNQSQSSLLAGQGAMAGAPKAGGSLF